jgi:hypothetical protein
LPPDLRLRVPDELVDDWQFHDWPIKMIVDYMINDNMIMKLIHSATSNVDDSHRLFEASATLSNDHCW